MLLEGKTAVIYLEARLRAPAVLRVSRASRAGGTRSSCPRLARPGAAATSCRRASAGRGATRAQQGVFSTRVSPPADPDRAASGGGPVRSRPAAGPGARPRSGGGDTHRRRQGGAESDVGKRSILADAHKGGAMSRLIISTATTVDAVMTVEDWYVSEGEHDRAGLELFDRAGALVLGRKNYEGLAAFWAPLTGPCGGPGQPLAEVRRLTDAPGAADMECHADRGRPRSCRVEAEGGARRRSALVRLR